MARLAAIALLLALLAGCAPAPPPPEHPQPHPPAPVIERTPAAPGYWMRRTIDDWQRREAGGD